MSDDGFYTMSDGREDVTWMRPYREAVQAFAAAAVRSGCRGTDAR